MRRFWSSRLTAFLAAVVLVFALSGCDGERPGSLPGSFGGGAYPDAYFSVDDGGSSEFSSGRDIVLSDGTVVAPWDGEDAYVFLNGGEPYFDEGDLFRTDAFEEYSELDSLGRCGAAYANICLELMPTDARGDIGSVKPTGWHTVKYDDLIPGKYLYNRCHLIGFQLAGENANPLNLITGTRYLNIEGMLDFENDVADYVEDTGNHVLYRVTPVFYEDNLVCDGVLMEAYSVEDGGDGLKFCAFAYNVQPGVSIDYATGESRRADGRDRDAVAVGEDGEKHDYVLNTSSGKFHLPECENASSMAEKNRLEIKQTLKAMLDAGYSPCGRCHPDALG